MSFCKESSIHLISDEVYGLSVYDKDPKHGYDFTSVLSVDTRGLIDEDRIHVFYGLSKVSLNLKVPVDASRGLILINQGFRCCWLETRLSRYTV